MKSGVLPAIIDELKQRGVGYVVTDLDLKIIATCGDPDLFPECDPTVIGLFLPEVAQELIGNESALISILHGAAERLHFDFINRELEDGRPIYVRITDFPYHDEKGEVVGLVHLLEDITITAVEQQRVLQQRNELAILQQMQTQTSADLTSAKIELGQINAFNQSFLAIAAHHLSEPLTAVGGFVELLQERTDATMDRHAVALEMLPEAVDKLYRVTDSLFNILRIGTEQLPTSLRPSDLDELVREAIADIASELQRKDVKLMLQVGENLPSVFCDEEQTVRLLRSLLHISVECAPDHGKLTVVLREEAARNQVSLILQCWQSDITAELLDRLAVLSNQHNRILLRADQGNSLELYVIFYLLKLQNGDIHVEDADQDGSVLVVSLPIAASG